jgi:hypothetical protein
MVPVRATTTAEEEEVLSLLVLEKMREVGFRKVVDGREANISNNSNSKDGYECRFRKKICQSAQRHFFFRTKVY